MREREDSSLEVQGHVFAPVGMSELAGHCTYAGDVRMVVHESVCVTMCNA